MSKESSAAQVVQPTVGEKWVTPDGIEWRVIDVWPQKVRLHTVRDYGVMTATASRVRFVKEARRVAAA